MAQSLGSRSLCAAALSGVASAQRGGAPPARSSRRRRSRSSSATWGPRPPGASRPSPACRAIPTPTTSARRRAASGSRPTAARRSCRSSTTSPSPRSARIAVRRLRSEHRLGRHRRAVGDSLQRRHGRRRLHVEGRRQDLEAHGTRRDRPHLARPHPSDQSQHRLRLRAGTPDGTAGRARRVQVDRRRRDTGSASCSSIATPAAPAWPWTRTIRTPCSPARGRSSSTRGRSSAAGRAAASTSRTTAARSGRRSTDGMPKPPVGKIDVAIAPSNTKRMYALIQTADQGSLWRSDDAGATWKVVSWDRSLIGRAGYYIRMAVNPQNPDDVFIVEQQLAPLAGRRQDVQRQRRRPHRVHAGTGELRRLPRRLDRSEGSRPLRPDRRRRREHQHAAGSARECRCRTARCITCTSTTACRTGSTATARTMARCAGRSTVSEQTGNGRLPEGSTMPQPPFGRGGRGRGGGGGRAAARPPAATRRRLRRGSRAAARGGQRRRPDAARAPAWQPNIGGCESGFTIPDPTDADVVYASLLRQQGDALGRAHRHRAIDRAVDGLARLAAEREQSTAATGPRRWRSIRSITTTCSTAAS